MTCPKCKSTSLIPETVYVNGFPNSYYRCQICGMDSIPRLDPPKPKEGGATPFHREPARGIKKSAQWIGGRPASVWFDEFLRARTPEMFTREDIEKFMPHSRSVICRQISVYRAEGLIEAAGWHWPDKKRKIIRWRLTKKGVEYCRGSAVA